MTRALLRLLPALLLAARSAGAAEAHPWALLDRLEAAWKTRDADAYLGLWELGTPEVLGVERDFAEQQLGSGESRMILQRPGSVPGDATRVGVIAQVVSINEPRGTVTQWMFQLARGAAGWTLAARLPRGRMDGLVHLSLDPAGYRADGLAVRLEDFELTMTRGTLFAPPASLGPTLLVFVGDGRVRFRPKPHTEQEQLRHFCGQTELVEAVSLAFVRIHPGDLHRVLIPARLEPDPEAARRLDTARRFYGKQSGLSFMLDADVPGSPWWLFPALGDALVSFETARHGTLSFAVSSSEPEAISLFDRGRGRQICQYPSGGRAPSYSDDEGRAANLLHHDLHLRVDPARHALVGEDTIRMRLLYPTTNLRLRLDASLGIESITSQEAGSHLFFRVRHQDSVMVSLGPLSSAAGELSLTVRYAGALVPRALEQEVSERLQAPGAGAGGHVDVTENVHIENVLVLTNREAWYPQAGGSDSATATLRLDVPAGYTAVTGGVRTASRVGDDRSVFEYRQDRPGKYMSVVVGRLVEAGALPEAPVSLQAFATARMRSDARDALGRAEEILGFYAEEFGPCPYATLNLVTIEGHAPGGHSPPGMVVLARRPPFLHGVLSDDPGAVSDVPGFFLAHELAHQWWGHGVTGRNYHERWLSEGVAQYAAALWVRRSRGEEAFRDVLRGMARWAFKDTDEGPISLGHRLGHVKGDPQVFRAVVYDKGAYVLHMLRGIVGEPAFREALKALQAGHRFSRVGTDDLREALETASGRDLAPYFREWVYGTALPKLAFRSRTEAGPEGPRVVVEVTARDLPGPVPLEISVLHEQGRQTKRVTLEPQGGTFAIDLPARPRKVEINADRGLLATVQRQ